MNSTMRSYGEEDQDPQLEYLSPDLSKELLINVQSQDV